MALVGDRGVLLGMGGVLRVRLVLAVAGVGGEVLLRVVGVMRRLAVVVLVEAAAAARPAPSSRTRGVLVRAGGPGLLVRLTDHAQQTCRWEGVERRDFLFLFFNLFSIFL